MADASTFRVDLRGSTLADAAALSEGERGPFLALERPAPVRSVLALTDAAGEVRVFEVSSVVEQLRGESPRGCFGRWGTRELLARASTVGSESLAPTHSVVAAPSPVVNLDESGIVAETLRVPEASAVHSPTEAAARADEPSIAASENFAATAPVEEAAEAEHERGSGPEGGEADDAGGGTNGEPNPGGAAGPRGKKRKARTRS